MFARSILLIVVLAVAANAFAPTRFAQRSVSLRMSDTEKAEGESDQTVQDLNLEEMFEVFEEADSSIADKKSTSTTKTVGLFDPKRAVGSSAPFGFFDPAGFSLDVEPAQFRLYQEAETKHCRVAMLAFLGLFFGEVVKSDTITGPAIWQFQQANADGTFGYWATWFIAMTEVGYILKNWQPLSETMREPLGLAKLKADVVPGDYGFDPLNLMPKDEKKYNEMKTKELNNGRLAMLGVAGIVAQELITDKAIFNF